MPVSLHKSAVAASNAEGLDVFLTVPPAGQYIIGRVPFAVESVDAAMTEGLVWLTGEFLDDIGGADRVLVPATHVLALVSA